MKRKTRQLLKDNNITAKVMDKWYHPRCKFLPGDIVMVGKQTKGCDDGRFDKYIGKVGQVIAVTTPNGKTVRSSWQFKGFGYTPGRMYTRYYVSFSALGNKVAGFHSHYLDLV